MGSHAALATGNVPIAVMGPQHGSGKPVSPQPRRGQAVNGSSTVGHGAELAGGRSLPDRHISEETVEDAYVQFMFYCNPYLPLSSDTAELRRGFQSMPRTDGRTFSPFKLFELIRKLEAREIETWGNLVLELGVKRPDVSSGQSTQKIQQYAVRLKRWLHAYHIDAFFQYCLGRSNPYFTEIPVVNEINDSIIRDGVPPEDDLALRALVPKWRPKRGRRPLDDGSDTSPNAKRQLRATSLTTDEQLDSALPITAYPQSAFPWDRHSNSTEAWLSTTRHLAPRTEQQRLGKSDQQHLAPPQQQSPPHSRTQHQPVPSIEPQMFYIDDEDAGPMPHSAMQTRPPSTAFARTTPTPQSAYPSTSAASRRGRKRHGGVSAAWAPDSGSGSKPRGRPPLNRNTQEGAFSTFPAKEAVEESANPAAAAAGSTPSLVPAANFASPQASAPGPTASSPPSYAAAIVRKPSKLQLQVPQHESGPVRLATPPRVVLQASAEARSRTSAQRASLSRLFRGTSAELISRRRDDASEVSAEFDLGEEDEIDVEREIGGDSGTDWKRRAMVLRKKVRELEEELRAVKRRVMEAVMA